MKVPVSIIVPVKNEEPNLARCLASIRWAGEIFVVDSHSTDATPRIAQDFNAEFVQFDLNGQPHKKKEWALRTLKLQHEWVFLIDADEELPADGEAVVALAIRDSKGINGYWVNRRFWFLGRPLEHAYFPNWNLRLFRHRLARFEQLTTETAGGSDVEVHEHVLVEGRTSYLPLVLEHYAYPTVDAFLQKHHRYANWEAAVDWGAVRHNPALPGRVGWRRRLRCWSQGLPFRPWLRFAYIYLWQRGFLDGAAGYYFARLHAYYEFLSSLKRFERDLHAHRHLGN
ncbi:MAG: glycosyltransferase family 2 protein [Verrucomicrobia bacterium]|nr:glycosyltransferase family 2 protein [Verrucomicrobiota bacterium]